MLKVPLAERIRTWNLAEYLGQRHLVDEDKIHRLSKSQEDSLLGAVEQGLFTLIGATI